VHQPVLLDEAVTLLGVVPGGVYLDGTFGLGGHTIEILKRSAPNGRVVAFDWDSEAIARGLENAAEYRDRLTVVRCNFAEIDSGLQEAGQETVDGILVDIGLSSLQLDDATRGFSFRFDEPLDMRMDQRKEMTAARIIAEASESELADILFYYGEEKQSRRIAGKIVNERRKNRIATTFQLADLVARSIPRKFHPPRIHVATRTFQALRIAVNNELTNLAEIINKGVEYLRPGGRFCVIAFHSLEDRIVKKAFAEQPLLKVVTRKPVVPGEMEIDRNPRSRSARLRAAERSV
jgi:16S rRNA (cytosine1402-N4)-methyltransferase